MERRLKEQDERMQAEIQRQVAATISQMTHSGALSQSVAQAPPLDPVISPTHRRSSCASTEAPEEHRAMEVHQVDETKYPVDDICHCTSCELHKPFENITMKV